MTTTSLGGCVVVGHEAEDPGGESATTDGTADGNDSGEPGEPDLDASCEKYIECVDTVAPNLTPQVLGAYGPEGSCWSPSTEEACRESCATALRQLGDRFPEEPACAECLTDDQCPEAAVCDQDRQACVECPVSTCGDGLCGTASWCTPCESSEQCDDGTCFDGRCGHEPLLPLATIGQWWRYEQDGQLCTIQVWHVLDVPEVGRLTEVVSTCANVDPTTYLQAVGDEVRIYDGNGSYRSTWLAEPVEEGTTWSESTSYHREWRREPAPVTVPAGTFEDCWTAARVGELLITDTFCRGVGLVRMAISSSEQPLSLGKLVERGF